MWNSYNVFRRFCAFLIGMVFFLAGILKLQDPVGAGLIVSEYYKFMHLGFLLATSKAVGTALALVETILGVALMSGLWRKVVSIVTYVFLGCFTVITLFLLIFNPTMDCGCFGEALHLTHLQSFIKNVILLGLSIVAFVPGRLGKPRRRKYVAFGIVSAVVVAFGIYSLLYIPLMDFTDFRPGARLEASLESSADSYDAVFVYERDGEEESFTLDSLPDSTWTYVRTETTRVEQTDDTVAALSFAGNDGQYVDYLAAHGDVMVFSIYDVQKMSLKKWTKLGRTVQTAENAGYIPLVLAADDWQAVSRSVSEKFGVASSVSGGLGYSEDIYGDWDGQERLGGTEGPDDGAALANAIIRNLYTADYKTLLTMNRSNGGATFFQDGTLVTKWARRALPSEKKLSDMLGTDMAETVLVTTMRRHITYECLVVVAFGILFFV
ncbi:MAG: hypothetical protein LUC24_00875 [Bacteroidales bacterium]|nr:hypothetical protein [Bacteroidales bacterium]